MWNGSTSRGVVTALNEIVWAVNPKHDSLNELAGYLGNFAEEFFRPGPIRCRLDIPGDLPERPIVAEVRHGVFLAFKEAINNVAKHSRATEVRVTVCCPNAELRLSVEDNGIGFDPVAKHAGNGLANMKHRLEKLGGSCDLRSAPGATTTVSFELNFESTPMSALIPLDYTGATGFEDTLGACSLDAQSRKPCRPAPIFRRRP